MADLRAMKDKLPYIKDLKHNEIMILRRIGKPVLFFWHKFRAHDVQWTSALRRPKWNGEEGSDGWQNPGNYR